MTYSAYTLFVNGVRLARDSEAKLAMQKTLITSIGLLSQELSESNPTAVRYDPFPQGVVFASPRDVNGALTLAGSGTVGWEKVIAYYVTKGDELVRKEWLLDPVVRQSGFPPSLGAGFSTADLEDEPLPVRTLSRGVDEFTITLNGNSAVIRLVAKQEDSRGRLNKVSLETGIQINN